MNRPLSVYIHIPFCEKKCDYCDFYSVTTADEKVMDRYVATLLGEIELYRSLFSRGIATVFFGGGTPSYLGSDRLKTILDALAEFTLKGAEITLEGNPESVKTLDVKKLISSGINRFSVGVQSGSDRLLAVMGRIHDVKTAEEAFFHLRSGGARNINLDFISSVPGEDAEEIEKSVALIEKLKPEHVSVYSLIVEEGTPFYRRYGSIGIEGEEDRRHVHRYEEALEALGYDQYEISNFSKSGYRCRHNLNYWHLGEYAALGPGASGYIGDIRYRNARDFTRYAEMIAAGRFPVCEYETLDALDRDNEYMMLGIRLNEGIPLDEPIPSGESFAHHYKEEIKRNLDAGLVEIEERRLRLTPMGRDLSNRVEVDFFRLPSEK